MKKVGLLCLLWASFVSAQNTSDTTIFNLDFLILSTLETAKYRFGDDPAWALPEYHDSSWQTIHLLPFAPEETGIYWYRIPIKLEGTVDDYKTVALRFSAIYSAFQCYWDGHLISVNGEIGETKDQETPGHAIHFTKMKSDWVKRGDHLLAIRASNFHGNKRWGIPWITFCYIEDWQHWRSEFLDIRYIWIGIYLTATIISLALFLGGGRHRPFLLFGLYCITAIIHRYIPILFEHFPIQITYLHILLLTLTATAIVSGIFLNIFIIFNFNIPRKFHHIALILLLIFASEILPVNIRSIRGMLHPIIILYANGLLIYSVSRKKSGSLMALAGLLILTCMMFFQMVRLQLPFSFDLSTPFIFLGYSLFNFCIIFSIGWQIKEQDRLLEDAKIHSARLETELLKKNIQPHFLMGTLLSIISFIKENPGKAIRLIQSFAEEFRIINKISSEKLIPIEQEIALCKTHIALMEYRREAGYRFKTVGIDTEETIPPMIFHTLLESTLSLSYTAKENGKIHLSCRRTGNRIHYCLQNNGSQVKKLSLRSVSLLEEDLGMRYVKASLNESYPGRWQLKYGLNNGLWEVNIIIEK